MQWVSLSRAVRMGGRPRGLWLVYVTGILSGLIVPVLLIVLGLITALLTTRGLLDLPRDEAEAVAAWAGDPDRSTGERLEYRARGLLPVVHHHRHSVFGAALAARYRSSTWMKSNLGCLIVLLLFGTLLAVVESLALGLFYLSARRVALEVGSRLRAAIYDQAFRIGIFDLLGDRVTQAEQLISEQVPMVEDGLARWWRATTRSVVILVACALLAVVTNVWLSLVILLMGVMVWLLYVWLSGRAESQVRLGDDRALRELDRLQQQLRQVPLVAGYLLSRIPGEPRDDTLRRHRQEAERAATSGLIVGPFLSVCVVGGAALALLLIGINVFRDPPGMTIGATVVLGSSLLVAFFPARRLSRLRAALPLAERAATAIFAYLDREPAFAEVAGASPLDRVREKVELESVTLADRQGRKLLNRVSLTIHAGSKTAIVASNSTVPIALAGLLARFYDPAAGQILFDGQDIRRATLQSVRQQATVVTGGAQLFSGTVSENIACGEDRFTQLQITDAAKQARAYNFIQQLPQGFSTIVGPQGHRLDAGQAFRIALSRVALRDPSVVVIQEPRATLDRDVEGHIDEALRRMAQDRAVVVLPTRLDTLRSADRVVLLHQGEVVGEGTHPELIQSSELYRHLTYVRFNPYRGQVDVT